VPSACPNATPPASQNPNVTLSSKNSSKAATATPATLASEIVLTKRTSMRTTIWYVALPAACGSPRRHHDSLSGRPDIRRQPSTP
jgi:hypothetical protein